MRSAPLLLAGVFCVALTLGAAAQHVATRRVSYERTPYFLDFRARGGGVLGHTFIVYGRMDASGRVLEEHTAGLMPDDAYNDSPVLAVALVPGYISSKPEDPSKPLTAVYRLRLTAKQYAHLRLTVRRLRATHRRWHMTFYNCNDFAGQIAREMGLIAPLAWARPTTFIRMLQALNVGRPLLH
jgi:hypothetical protein